MWRRRESSVGCRSYFATGRLSRSAMIRSTRTSSMPGCSRSRAVFRNRRQVLRHGPQCTGVHVRIEGAQAQNIEDKARHYSPIQGAVSYSASAVYHTEFPVPLVSEQSLYQFTSVIFQRKRQGQQLTFPQIRIGRLYFLVFANLLSRLETPLSYLVIPSRRSSSRVARLATVPLGCRYQPGSRSSRSRCSRTLRTVSSPPIVM